MFSEAWPSHSVENLRNVFLDLLRFYVKLSLEDFEHEIWRFDTFEDFGN